MVEDDKTVLLEWVERDRDLLVDFASRFVRIPTPNPPGRTVEAAGFVTDFLKSQHLPFDIIAPRPDLPNIVATFAGGAGAGPHLVLNGHMDVFPVGEEGAWSRDPWSGAVEDGRIHGRGATDMKAGSTASIFTYAYLARLRERLHGKLTLTIVSDEETFGEWGSRYLIENHPELRGDCCLNAEPSSPHTIRFGEKGMLWLRFEVQARGGHSAYPHRGESAVTIALDLIRDLETLKQLPVNMPDAVARAIEEGSPAIDRGMGAGATDVSRSLATNVGCISGGVKINMIPEKCSFDFDVRYPVGLTRELVMEEIARILARYPGAHVEELKSTPANWSDPYGAMAEILQANVRSLKGFSPSPIISLGGTDARFWRVAGTPAYVYGPSPEPMARADEYVEIEEFLHTLKVHLLSAYDYLSRPHAVNG